MDFEQLATWSQVIASVAVFVSLIFVAYELRMSTKVARAQARHNLSHFAAEISRFEAEHADRLAKVHSAPAPGAELSAGDGLFRFWNHVQVLMHAETFYSHFRLGLMPHSHWEGYCNFFSGSVATPGFAECWEQMRKTVAPDFAHWVDSLRERIGTAGG